MGDDEDGVKVRVGCGEGVPSETHLWRLGAGVGDCCCFDGVCGLG